MRIISGKFKGRKIEPPAGLGIRPTTDRAREALFNILQHKIDFETTQVLDLFGGSGAVSIEFISRGAKSVTCVEKLPKIARYLKQTIVSLAIENCTIYNMDALLFIKQTDIQFDCIFMDPPYQAPYKLDLIQTIFTCQLLAPHGLIIVEHDVAENFSQVPGWQETRNYSLSAFSFFSYVPQEPNHGSGLASPQLEPAQNMERHETL